MIKQLDLERNECNMDYKELANIMFPGIKDASYYEEKYPKRKLKEGAMVVRFAPSPTGFVHIRRNIHKCNMLKACKAN